MEYKYLAHLTGRKKYFDKVQSFINIGYLSSPLTMGCYRSNVSWD